VGKDHTCGTRLDDTSWCWGRNAAGQLGQGDQINRKHPVQVGRSADWAFLGAGGRHTCGVRLSHTLWCWGGNGSGQLGLGDTRDRLFPKRV
jgi:alpha-tubulin suppressor-like RCC1 family protein